MRLRVLFMTIMSLGYITPRSAHAESLISACANAITYTTIATADDLALQYAYLKMKVDNSTSSNNPGGGITVPIYGVPFTLGYQDAVSRTRDLSQTLGINWDMQKSSAYLARYVSASSNEAFKDCVSKVISSNPPIAIEVLQATESFVSLKFHIGKQPAATAPLIFNVQSNGNFARGLQREWTVAGGEPTIIISRRNLATDLMVSAQVVNQGRELGSEDIVFPPFISTTTNSKQNIRYSNPSQASCGNQSGRAQEGWGDRVSLSAEEGEIFDIARISDETVSMKNGRADKPFSNTEYHMDIIVKDQRFIVAAAWCKRWSDELYQWTGRIKVPSITYSYVTQAPVNNGVDTNQMFPAAQLN
ncbi:hypothetical protein MVG78_01570 [Roseomonas gilardii subsp. gilardii]|uniref:hypothetical protein n=1 Tax=Roseomonas gilardii TaxID=257708 RepID=UPI001FF97FF8|nr:hypothetical protein [Roseomonas gilardii]UPG72914.1 hypothetical protein MVG78_01570 [Roseomonas gilardii subsp. gilardii]